MAAGKSKKAAVAKNRKKMPSKPAVKKHAQAATPAVHTPRCVNMWKHHLLNDSNVRQMLINLAGEHTLHVISEFNSQMSDEEIAKKTKLRTSDVRVVLNKLHSCGLVSYSRSRDKNSGWYSYVWKLNNDKAKEIVCHLMAMNGCSAHVEMSENGGEFYVCPACDGSAAVPFEDASTRMFKCQQCGSSLEYANGMKK